MLPLLPTGGAVAAAIAHHRKISGLSYESLEIALADNGHPISALDLALMEVGEAPVTVDDLVAIAFALDTTPTDLLTHIDGDDPSPEYPFATGLPGDAEMPEVRDWILGRARLDRASRLRWWRNERQCLLVRRAHVVEHLEAARAELTDLGELALQEADALPVQRLHARIHDGEFALDLVRRAMARADRHVDDLFFSR